MPKIEDRDAFDVFKDSSPKSGTPSTKLLFEYEKFYMELLEKHHKDIEFINNLLKDLRKEELESTEKIKELEKKLKDQKVDEKIRNLWLKHLVKNMRCSFQLSNELIEHFMIMKKDEFITELKKRLEICMVNNI